MRSTTAALRLLPALLPMFLLGSPALAATPGRPPSAPTAPSGPAITYTYDGAGRLVEAKLGTTATITYTYDVAGNLLKKVVMTSIGDPTGDGSIDVFDSVALANLIVGNVTPGQPPFLGTLQSVNLNPSQGPGVDVFDLLILMNFIVGNYASIPI